MDARELFVKHSILNGYSYNGKYIILNEDPDESLMSTSRMYILIPVKTDDYEIVKMAKLREESVVHISKGRVETKFIASTFKSSSLNEKMAKKYIPHTIVKCIKNGTTNSYKCYAGMTTYDYKNPSQTLIIHEDAISSWNCIKAIFDNPEAFLILKFDRDGN